ncbi:MAG: dipeptide epimerase [Hyphomicrobiaceae bacterium]|nr:dipeptide epimerase [Hyphomicrobiaceae bacterium]
MIRLEAVAETFPIAGRFAISRGARTEIHVVTVTLTDVHNGRAGRGECVPYARYGESVEGVIAAIREQEEALAAGLDRKGLQAAMPPGAARNALDCAFWDLEAKTAGRSAASLAGMSASAPLVTAYTLSLDTPEAMQASAAANAARPLLKIKLGLEGDEARLRAVRAGAPNARLIVDANEGWSGDQLVPMMALCAEMKVDLIEQPLPAKDDALLARVAHPVPVCADESAHALADFPALAGKYEAINIKLDKTGGLTEALALKAAAEAAGMKVMVGCMLGTSLAMAPATLVAEGAAFVDLDGPLLLAADREPPLVFEGSIIRAVPSALWG